MTRELDEILTHVDKLNEVDTADVEPMAQVLFDAEETATLREDCERPRLEQKPRWRTAALKGAGYFKVPRVIER